MGNAAAASLSSDLQTISEVPLSEELTIQAHDFDAQMTREQQGQTEWSGTWQVVRDGEVVATVDWDSLGGTACRGSGIGGV